MREEGILEINVISARDIKKMIGISRMKVYVVVYLKDPTTGEKLQKVKTLVDQKGGVNPTWNFLVTLRVPESLAQQNALDVVFKLKRDGTVVDRVAGKVTVPVKKLLDETPLTILTRLVMTPSGKLQGELDFSYKFIPNAALQQQEPVSGYQAVPPVGPSSSSSALPSISPNQVPATGYPSSAPSVIYLNQPPATGYPHSAPPYHYPTSYPSYSYQPPRASQPPPQIPSYMAPLVAPLVGRVFADWIPDDVGYDAGFGDAGGNDAGFGDAGGI